MEKYNFLRFLILWITLSQGFSFSSDANSSDLLVRKRRVIDRRPNANTRVNIRNVPYVVNIKKNYVHACAGNILSTQVILTTVNCINEHAIYTVVSGTVSTISRGTNHFCNGILRHPLYIPPSFTHNIALLSINPPITFGENINRPIPIYQLNNGQLPPNTLVTVSGFGLVIENHSGGIKQCFSSGIREQRLIDPNELRAIHLPTISLQACRVGSQNNSLIANEMICTFHALKSCSPGEYGNPLVFNDQLVGILVSDGFFRGSDIFVNVAVTEHKNWILSHMSPINIPKYIPPPLDPPVHYQRRVQKCSQVHPCIDENHAH